MGVPQKKTSKSRRDKRRSHHHLEQPNWMDCPECGEAMQRHRACPHCGMYKGKQVVEIIEKGT